MGEQEKRRVRCERCKRTFPDRGQITLGGYICERCKQLQCLTSQRVVEGDPVHLLLPASDIEEN